MQGWTTVILQGIADTALLTQTYLIREDDNEKFDANNETIKKIVDKFDKAIQSEDRESISKYIEVW